MAKQKNSLKAALQELLDSFEDDEDDDQGDDDVITLRGPAARKLLGLLDDDTPNKKTAEDDDQGDDDADGDRPKPEAKPQRAGSRYFKDQ